MTPEKKSSVLTALANHHVGQQNGTSGEMLALETRLLVREVRHAVTALREDGLGVCAHPSKGYFLAETDAELDEFCIEFLKHRAMHSLKLIAILKRSALLDLIGQLKLEN